MTEGSLLLGLGPWLWIVAGGVLLGLELVVPGTIMLWFGLAALATGAIAMTTALSWQVQIILFAVLAAASLFAWRRFGRRLVVEPDTEPGLNQRAERHVGRVVTLDAPIVNGEGRIRIDDSPWRIAGADCPAGSKVKVTGTDGSVLRVEPV